MAKELVVYFSVYGTARIVAEEIAKQTGADIAEIADSTVLTGGCAKKFTKEELLEVLLECR